MIEKIKSLLKKHRHIIAYLIVGVLTTAVDFVVYYFPGVSLIPIASVRNTVAWAAAVIFAFFGNRFFVFTENTKGQRMTFREFGEFALSRLFSLIAGNVTIELLIFASLSSNFAKIPSSVIVVVLNYITGKIVFRNKKK